MCLFFTNLYYLFSFYSLPVVAALDYGKQTLRGADFSNIDLNETMMQVLKDSKKIVGVLHHISVHPGGVIIVPDEIRKYVPVLWHLKEYRL